MLRSFVLVLALASVFGCNAYQSQEDGAQRGPEGEVPELPAAEDEPGPARIEPAPQPPAAETPEQDRPTSVLPSFTQPTRDEDAGASSGDEAWPQHPQGNDLTAPCHRDEDCNYGACYVPGRGPEANPICSKRCDSDADCPSGALCAAPLECTDGVGCEGSGYCFRACEGDAACQAFNPLGVERLFDDDNPVVCVHWSAIGEDQPRPAIDICIQHSEP